MCYRAKYIVDDSISIVKESFDNDITPYYALAISIWGLASFSLVSYSAY